MALCVLLPGSALAEDPGSPSDTQQFLRAAGFTDAIVHHRSDTVTVTYSRDTVPPGVDPVAAVADVVWQTESLRFDELRIAAGLDDVTTVTYEELGAFLGPRPSGFDQVTMSEYYNQAGAGGAAAGAMFEGFLGAVKLIAIVLIVVAATLWLGIIAMAVASIRTSGAASDDATAW